MKKVKAIKWLFFVAVLFVVGSAIINVDNSYADDLVAYYDELFASGEYTIYTDTLTDNASLSRHMNFVFPNPHANEYHSGSFSYDYLNISECSISGSSCKFEIKRNTNNKYSIVKDYGQIHLNIVTDLSAYFPMMDGYKLVVNYDEDLISSEDEKVQIISNYLRSFNENNGSRIIEFSRDAIYSHVIRREKVDGKYVKFISKQINEIVFDYKDESYSEDYKKLTSGTLTIKTDTAIDKYLLNNYLLSFSGPGFFTVDKEVSNNKALIKLTSWNNGETITEEHIVTLVQDPNIDVAAFSRAGYSGDINIQAEMPSDVSDYISRYFNSTNYYFDNGDGTYDSLEEQFDYEHPSRGLVKYIRYDSTTGAKLDIQMHGASIGFVGYSDVVSDDFSKKIGSEIVINADKLDLYTIDSALMNMNGSIRVLGCNGDYSVCDIALFDYNNYSIEIHKVNINLDNSISDEFKRAFSIKEDGSIDIIMDNDIVFSWGFTTSGYEPSTGYSRNFDCDKINKCRLVLTHYPFTEAHEVRYNVVNSARTDYYSSLINSSIDVYPGETTVSRNRINDSHFAKVENYYDYFLRKLECNPNTSKCAVSVFNSDNKLEIRNVDVVVKSGWSPQLSAIVPDARVSLNSIYGEDRDYVYDVSRAYFLSKEKSYTYLDNYRDGKARIEHDGLESHTVDVDFVDGDQDHKAAVEEAIAEIDSISLQFEINDLEFINVFYYNDFYSIATSNFDSKTINDTLTGVINNKHISYFLVNNGGGGDRFEEAWGGRVVLYYDGIAYGEAKDNMVITKKNIIYIPDDTPDSKEEYVKAAQRRVDDYLGENSGATISFLEELDDDWASSIADIYGIANFDGNCYQITYKDKSNDVLIIRDSSKMQTSTFNAADVNNNINVSSDNANYPTNTVVSAEKIEEGSSEYNDLVEKLGVEKAQIVDIDLYSPTIGDIKDFNGVSFNVSLPIDEGKFGDGELFAYYVGKDGAIEEHPVIIDDFIGTFGADHFSTYVISEKSNANMLNVESPGTLDNIMRWSIVGGLSAFVILGAGAFIKTKKRIV